MTSYIQRSKDDTKKIDFEDEILSANINKMIHIVIIYWILRIYGLLKLIILMVMIISLMKMILLELKSIILVVNIKIVKYIRNYLKVL